VCILQAINEISITNGVPTSAIPLAFVLFFDGIVTAREDYVRHRDDARANSRNVEAIRDGRFATVQWREVRVGDIVKVYGGDEFPADMIFLAAGEAPMGTPPMPRLLSPPTGRPRRYALLVCSWARFFAQATTTRTRRACATCRRRSWTARPT